MRVTVKVLFFRYVYIMRQRWCLAMGYFLFPLILLTLAVWLYSVFPYAEYKGEEARIFVEEGILMIQNPVEILVCPDGDAERQLMENVQHSLSFEPDSQHRRNGSTPANVTFVNDTRKMEDLLVSSKNDVTMGVHFHQVTSTKLEYSIRPQAFNVPPTNMDWGDYRTKERFPSPMYRGPRQYVPYFEVPITGSPGLITLQVAIDKAYIQTYFGDSIIRNWALVSFPYPTFTDVDPEYINVFTHRFTLLCVQYLLIISILFMISVFASYIIRDKMSGVKELLSVNGAQRWMVNISWLMSFCLEAIILSVAEMGMLRMSTKNGALIQYMSASVLSIVLVVYNLSSLCWAYFIATLSTNNVLCISIVISYWVISPILLQWIPPGHFALQAGLAPLPNAGMVLIFKSFQEFDGAETLVDLKHLSTSPIHYRPINDFLLIMLATSVLLVLLSSYVDLVKPGPYGRAKPWCLFTFKCKDKDLPVDETTNENEFFDYIKKQDPIGLECVGIYKFFGKNKALDNVNLKILKNKVTVLLGHNGAGKTALISILCGMYSPTRGKLYTENYDVFKGCNIKRLRKVLGYCPQSNILMNDLTFQQNLIIFSMLKGLSRHEAEEYSDKWTTTFHIENCRNKQVKYLSGGDRRKLTLGIAVSGNPQYLLLDYPTSGLDAKSKRKFWNIILQKKGRCTVVLSTYNMDEADILGDRIVHMVYGELKAHVASAVLKKKMGLAHTVTCVVNEDDVVKLIRIVTTLYSSIIVLYRTNRSVTFGLPTDFKSRDVPKLLRSLESEFGEDISSGVSYVTTDDVMATIHQIMLQNKVNVKELRMEERDINQSCWNYDHIKETLKKKMKWTFNQSLALMIILVMLLPLIGMESAVYVTKRTLGRNSSGLRLTDLKFTPDKYSGTIAALSKAKSTANDALRAAMNNSGITYEEVDQEMIVYLARSLSSKDLFEYRSRYVLSFEVTRKFLIGYFSRIAFHAAPIAYSVVINAVLRGRATIVTHNFPFVKKHEQLACMFDNAAIGVLLVLTLLGPILLIAGSYFIIFPHIERRTLFKHLQLMAGLLPAVYWISNLVFDLFIFSTSCMLMIIIMTITDIHFFWNFTVLCVFVLVLLLYGISTIAFSYVWSFCRCSIPAVVTWYFIVNAFLLIGYFILDIITSFSAPHFVPDERYLYFLPWVTLMDSLRKISLWAERSRQCYECQNVGSCSEIREGSLIHSLKSNLIAFLFTSLGYFTVILAMDHGFGRRLKPIISRVWYGDTVNGYNCPETGLEKARVRDLYTEVAEEQPELVCDGLGKKYSSKITAVRDVTFVTDRGQRFGLLGPNGSGKSTIFGMLAGLISPTKGTATIRGKWELGDCDYKYIRNIGYNPAFDGLLPGLSGRTTLRLFARLRGLNKRFVDSHVEKWLDALDMKYLAHLANQPCDEYSGGTRRKLNFAIAMIVNPSVVLLDEPITGIDPFVQRTIREILMDVTSGQAIVLTTHNMLECETLCGRLAIIVNGDMKCIGSIPKLKKSLGKTCVLQIRFLGNTTPSQLNAIQFKIEFQFAGHINLKAKPVNHLIYNVGTEKNRIYDVFALMLKIKEENPAIDDFSITEAPLEEIFAIYTRIE